MKKRIPLAMIIFCSLTACGPNERPRIPEVLPRLSGTEKESALIPDTPIDDENSAYLETPSDSSSFPIASDITPLVPSLVDRRDGNSPKAAFDSGISPSSHTDSTDTIPPASSEIMDEPQIPADPLNSVSTLPLPPAVVIPFEAMPSALPANISTSTPIPIHPPEDTYEKALAEIDQYRSDVAPFVRDSATDHSQGTVWLGDGVNALNGERTPSCLNLGTLSKQTNKVAQTHDNFEFIQNYYDFWKKMGHSVSVGGKGVFPWFTLGVSAETSSEHDIYINKDSLLAIASFNYVREEQTLYNARPAFAPFFGKQLTRNKGLFRSLCGDRFTKSVSLGGSMRIVFNAKKHNHKTYNKDTVKATLDLGFNTLFSLNSSFSFSKEQQEILNNHTFSMKCFTSGTKANICAEFGLNTSFDFATDGVSLQQRMDEARKRMAADVDKGENLVIISEKFADYETPISLCTLTGDEACPSAEQVYYNFRPRLDTAFKIMGSLEKIDGICTITSYWRNRCNSVRNQLTESIRKCAQASSSCEDLRDTTELNILLSAAHPGRFSIWTDTDRRSHVYSHDFQGGDATGTFLSNTFYTFSDMGWDKLNDKASSVEVHLAPGWTLRFWEHKQIDRRGFSLDMRNEDYISNLWKMNDKISSFELIPVPDLHE